MSRGGNTGNGFDKDTARARAAGEKSKRKGLDEQLQELSQELTDEGITTEEAINRKLIEKAREGEFAYLKEYLDRKHGKSIQRSEIDANVNSNISLHIDPDEADI